jgi:pyruvate dehydrogenase E2 component (dihydrolipoamide acetyltransferase)
MATPVEMPKLGNTVEECIIAKWRRRKGDSVSAGDVIAEIETDKATFEVAAPVSGTLLETFFKEGALVPVFTNLFVIGEPGEDADSFRPMVGRTPGAAAGPLAGSAANVKKADEGVGRGPGGPPYSPRAKRFAGEHHFHPARVTGSGPGARVLEEDVRREYFSSSRISREEQSTISNIREKIARRMRESLAATAQYTLNSSAGAGGLLTLRARIKASTGVPDININDLVTFCAIKALLQMPDLNAEFIDSKIHKHSEIHMGFACDTPRGLIVPVIRNAHALTIAELATEMKELTAQAVQGTISPDSLSGATFTISNLGGLGIESFTPLLNPPQVAILGVGAIQVKPVRRQGKLEFIDAIGLSLTCDHQVIDGAPGARFLQIVKEKIENVESLCTI